MGLTIVGDVMLARRVAPHLADIVCSLKSMKHSSQTSVWAGNLESPVCTALPTRPRGFCASPDVSKDALQLFDVLSVANNHALDCGVQGFHETIAYVRQLGIKVVGSRNSEGWQSGAVVRVGDRLIGFLGYVEESLLPITPPVTLATCTDMDQVAREIQVLKTEVDFVVCLLHAGHEMVRFPVEVEKVLPRRFVELGVDLVVRSHAHVVQGYEHYHSAHILFGLGDFVFDGEVRRRQDGALVEVDWTDRGLELRPRSVRRDRQLRLHFKERTIGFPPTPRVLVGVRRKIDVGLYYIERAYSLLRYQPLQGAKYILQQLKRRSSPAQL